jgi:hypothetical protein
MSELVTNGLPSRVQEARGSWMGELVWDTDLAARTPEVQR